MLTPWYMSIHVLYLRGALIHFVQQLHTCSTNCYLVYTNEAQVLRYMYSVYFPGFCGTAEC